MDYTETEASRMLKKYNDTLYETLHKPKVLLKISSC